MNAAKSDMPKAPSEFGKNLDAIMKARGLTNQWLAGETGLDPSAISRLRTGGRGGPTERSAMAIAAALDVDLEDLTGAPKRRDAHAVREIPAPAYGGEEAEGDLDGAEILALYAGSELAHQDKPTPEEINYILARVWHWTGSPPTAKSVSRLIYRRRAKATP